MKFTLDTLAFNNALRRISPVWKIGFAGALLLITNWSHPNVQLMIFFWMILWTVGYARTPVKPYFILLGSAFVFYLAGAPALFLEISRTATIPDGCLFSWSGHGWVIFATKAGLQSSLFILTRTLSSLTCLFFILFTVPFFEILQVMKWMRVPSVVIELMLVMYRFIFIMADTAYGMFIAQQARGGHQNLAAKMSDMSLIIVHLFANTLQRFKALSYGLMSRGFTEEIALGPLPPRTVPPRFQLEAMLGSLALLILETWIRMGD